MSLYRALVLFGTKSEDKSETPFQWARVLTDNPVDDAGVKVKNPGSIMVYGTKGFRQGDCEEIILISRGIAGLYDLIPADKAEMVLKKMKKNSEDLPEVPLAESTSNTKDRTTARKEAAEARKQRRQSGRAAETASAEIEEMQPE